MLITVGVHKRTARLAAKLRIHDSVVTTYMFHTH